MSPPLTAGSRIGRWTLELALGAGSFGSAWRAVDDDGRVAALKLLGGPPGGEVEALARVCHPAVPAVLDAQGEPVPFVAMSLARGRTLTQMIRAGRATEEPAIAVAAVVADALAVLHHAGLSHGDIKPDNIVVGSVRRCEIMVVDFGLAGGESGGTLQYAAPERLSGSPPSPAADIYALGLVLWEMLRGNLPFAELGISAGLMRRRSEAPVLVDHSPWLCALLGAMLQPDPARRPDANTVTDALAAQGAQLPRITPELVRSRARTVHVAVAEVDAALEHWLDQGGTLLVQGSRHSGRSHSLQRAITRLQARGSTWMRLPSLSQAWGAVTEALADPTLPGAPCALPEHPHLLDRAEAAAAALEERAPSGLALLVDDLDCLDPGSLATLEALARRGNLAICASGTAAFSWLEHSTQLRPLDGEGLSALLCGILGVAQPIEGLVERCMAVSGGVPGLAVDFLAAACREDALVRRAQRWLVDEAALDDLAARDLMAEATPFERGSPPARLGGLLAAAGAAVDLSRLPALLQLDAGTVDVALQRLLQLGLVVVEHDRARCASRAAAASLRQGCDESVAFHRLLAMALLSEEAEAPSRLAWHLVGGEDVETALDRGPGLLARVTLMDPGEGARLAEALWALAPSPAMAARRIDALHLAGKVDEAIAFGEEKRAAGEVDVDLLVALARALLSRADDTEAAIATAGQARGLLQGMAPPLALVLIEAKALFRADRIDEAIAICAQAPAPAADSAVELLDDWLTLRVVQAQSIHRAGDVHAAILNLEEVPPRFGYGRPARALLDGCLGRLLYHAGRFGDAAEVMGRAAATDAGLSALDRARMLNNAGLVSYQSGRRLKALEHWEEALLLFERLSAPVDQIRVSVNLCVGYREAGRWERGRQAGTWAAEAAAKRELPELEAMAAGNVGDLFLDQRRFTDAERWYLKAGRIARSAGLDGELVELARRSAELATLRDDADALVRADEALRMADAAGQAIEAARSRALRAVCLARRSGDEGMITELIDQARNTLREAGAAGELATVRLLAAEAWLALGQPDRAVSECDRVIVFAEEMGHVGLRSRADLLLAEARKQRSASEVDQRLDRLVSLAVAVARSQDDEQGLLDTIAEAGLELLGGERAFVIRCDPKQKDGAPQVVAQRFREAGETGKPSLSVVRRVLESRTEIIAADLGERGDLREAKSVMDFSLRSAMCVPMIEGDELLGVIYVDSKTTSEAELSRSARFMRALAAHAAVAVANARRVQAIRDRAAWAAEVAHDMRSPVSSVVTLARMVLEDPRDTGLVTECMDDILLAGSKALEMAEGFLTQGKRTRITLSASEWVTGVCRILAPLALEREVVLTCEVDSDLQVLGDRVELGRALQNLVSNAIKYSDAGGRVAVVACGADETLQITVRDHGRGVPEAALSTIFGRGVQAPGARAGHGLGLAVVQRIAEDHGGRIAVANHPDGGALFTLCLPLTDRVRQAV